MVSVVDKTLTGGNFIFCWEIKNVDNTTIIGFTAPLTFVKRISICWSYREQLEYIVSYVSKVPKLWMSSIQLIIA